MKKKRKHTERGGRYEALAEGYKVFNSPLAELYSAAAAHYHERDPAIGESDEPQRQDDGPQQHVRG
jgi:hypothetical protein